MLEAPTINYEIVEEIWTMATYSETDKILSFSLKVTKYVVSCEALTKCLHLSVNNCEYRPTELDIRTMLEDNKYVDPNTNLGKIIRKN